MCFYNKRFLPLPLSQTKNDLSSAAKNRVNGAIGEFTANQTGKHTGGAVVSFISQNRNER